MGTISGKCKNEGVRAGLGVLSTLWASP